MFRKMRRFKQELTHEEAIQILNNNTAGVLAVLGDEGYPYSVPLSYVFVDNKIYFHSAKTGHKIDAIKNYNKASFCVIDQNQIMPEEYTTYFRSVIAFGKVHIMENEEEIRVAMSKFVTKYSSYGKAEKHEVNMKEVPDIMAMIEFDIEYMTGKWKEKGEN